MPTLYHRFTSILPARTALLVAQSNTCPVYLWTSLDRRVTSDTKGRSKVIQWLMFQMAGIGPMMGQANVFFHYFPEKIQPAINRYQNESRRLSPSN